MPDRRPNHQHGRRPKDHLDIHIKGNVEKKGSTPRSKRAQECEVVLNVLKHIDAQDDIVGRYVALRNVRIVESHPLGFSQSAESEPLGTEFETIEHRFRKNLRQLDEDFTCAAPYLGDTLRDDSTKIEPPLNLPGLPRRIFSVKRRVPFVVPSGEVLCVDRHYLPNVKAEPLRSLWRLVSLRSHFLSESVFVHEPMHALCTMPDRVK